MNNETTIEAPAAPAKPAWMQAISKDASFGMPRSILLYGEAGTRKTSLAAALVKRPNKPKVLLIDADNGSESIINDPDILAAKRDGRLDVVSIDPTQADAFQKIDFIVNDVIANDYGYEFTIIDTFGIAQEVAVRHFLANTFNANGKLDTLAAWGAVGVWTDRIARGLHNAPHTTGIFILHERSDAEETGASKTKPKLSGGMRDTIASIPSIVANLSFEKAPDGESTELVARLGESDQVVSKNRYSSMLDPVMRGFDLLDLYAKLDEKLGVDSLREAA
jgi:hypothetical protein